MKGRYILLISILLLLLLTGSDAQADQERCRVERASLAFFTAWSEDAPTPPNVAEEMF